EEDNDGAAGDGEGNEPAEVDLPDAEGGAGRQLGSFSTGGSSVLDGFSEDSPLQQGDRHERDEHEDRHDRGVAESEEFEGRVVQQHDDGLTCACRSALGRGVNLIEDLEVENELENADHDDL